MRTELRKSGLGPRGKVVCAVSDHDGRLFGPFPQALLYGVEVGRGRSSLGGGRA